jgi:hypothetical protein
VNDVGEPCAGEPHARFDAAAGGNPGPVGSGRAAPGRLPPTLPSSRADHETACRNARPWRIEPVAPVGNDSLDLDVGGAMSIDLHPVAKGRFAGPVSPDDYSGAPGALASS